MLNVVLLGGCVNTAPSTGVGSTQGHPAVSDERIAEIHTAIEEQSRQIAELRAALQNQEETVEGDIAEINESLDAHLELLELFYRQINQTPPPASTALQATPQASSIFGTAAISQRRGDPLTLKRVTVHLIKEDAMAVWDALSQPRTLYNTPIKNAETILTALEFERDLEKPRTPDEIDSNLLLRDRNSHFLAFEKRLKDLTSRPATSTAENGKYFFNDVPPGNYCLYARISPETYSVGWLIPLRIEGGSATETNLDSANAKVLLNDLGER